MLAHEGHPVTVEEDAFGPPATASTVAPLTAPPLPVIPTPGGVQNAASGFPGAGFTAVDQGDKVGFTPSGALQLMNVYIGGTAVSSIARCGVLREAIGMAAPSALTSADVFMARAQNSALETGFRFAVRVVVADGSPMSQKLQTLIRRTLSRVDPTTLDTLRTMSTREVVSKAALGSALPLLIALAIQEVLLINDVVAGRMTPRAAAQATGRNVVTAVAGAAGMAAGAAVGSLMFPGFGTAIGSLIGSGMCAAVVRSYTELPSWRTRPLMVPAADVSTAAAADAAANAIIDGDAGSIASTAMDDGSSVYASSTLFVVRGGGSGRDAVQFSYGPGQFEAAISTGLYQPPAAAAAAAVDPLVSMPDITALQDFVTGGEKLTDAEVADMSRAQQSEAAVRERSRANLAEYQRVRATPPASGKNVGHQEVVLVFCQSPPSDAHPAHAVMGGLAAAAAAAVPELAHEFGNRQPGFGFSPPASNSSVQAALPFGAVPSGDGCASSARRALHRSSVRFDSVAGDAAFEGEDALGRMWVS